MRDMRRMTRQKVFLVKNAKDRTCFNLPWPLVRIMVVSTGVSSKSNSSDREGRFREQYGARG